MARRVAGRARAAPGNVGLTVKVVYISASDNAARMSRAISLLLAAAQPDEDSGNNNGSKNQGKAPAGNEYQGDSTDTG
jgi:hypothetical protein